MLLYRVLACLMLFNVSLNVVCLHNACVFLYVYFASDY